MNAGRLTYAAVTPVRNESGNVRRLADCLDAQIVRPTAWVIVDNGSVDDTPEVVRQIAATRGWVHAVDLPGSGAPVRGGPIVRAFHVGLASLRPEDRPDIVVKLDADVSVDPDYFERLLEAFADDPELGIASGSGYEREGSAWVQRHTTGTSVWGATRAYRWACLQDVLPLEERMGWDGIDEHKALARGWHTQTLTDLPFRHHRREGARDGSAWKAWTARGQAAHYMGYRGWYLMLRSFHHAVREPAALGLLKGFALAAARREPVLQDTVVRDHLRGQQTVRSLRARRREALGLRGS